MMRKMLIASLLPIAGACQLHMNDKGDHTGGGANTSPGKCLLNNSELCHVEEDSKALHQAWQDALRKSDTVRASEILIELNRTNELKEVKTEADLTAIESKYSLLRQIFQDELHQYNTTGFVNNDQRKNSFDDEPLYQGPNFTSSYHPLVLGEVKKVFNDFGDLYVKDHKLNKDGKPLHKVVMSERRPWSGFWYPVTSNALSPILAKVDQVFRGRGIQSNIAEAESKLYKGYSADSWEGLCFALSMASVSTPEPTQSKIIDGIEFTIAEQKALATYTHSLSESKQYGISYDGTYRTDGTFQDLKPEAFHRIVTYVLGVEKRALIADDTAGIQVWNKPLFRLSWFIEKHPKFNYIYQVKAFPWFIKERSEETNRLTSQLDIIAPVYTYNLYVDRSQVKSGKYRVIAGQWTERSYADHPDTVNYPAKTPALKTHNAEFNKYLPEYEKIFTQN